MKSLMQWLSEPFEGHERVWSWGPPSQLPQNPTRLQVVAALQMMDKGNGCGIIQGGGLYGRIGLGQREAFAYWDLRSFINGWLTATDKSEEHDLVLAIRCEWERVEQWNKDAESARPESGQTL